ncbi:hypothetical protein [Nocardia sp. NPDC058497]|uniref:DUF7065 domain-containing protein n=1 Tax=Nocardia sp. NPDC058497 TaxID=3346529 RepID=UPI0036492A12
MHESGRSPHWQESFYFNWSTADGRSFGLTRIGVDHASGTGDAVVVMLHDGAPELVYGAVGVDLSPEAARRPVADGLTVGRLTYTMVEPLRCWRISLRGRDALDLVWRSSTPAVDFHAGFPGDKTEVQRHFEQSGRVEGEIRVNGRTARISGLGQRDKSWGVRDWNGIRGWEWIVGHFGDDLAFNATLTDIGGVRTPTGYVFDASATDPVRLVREVGIEYSGADPHRPEAVRLRIHTDVETYLISGRARARIPLYKKGLFIEETQFGFECEHGDRVRQGTGVVEHAYHVKLSGLAMRLPRLLPVLKMAKEATR